MAGIKHTWARSIKNDAGNTVLSESVVFTATAEENIRDIVPANDDLDILINVDVSLIESFFIKSNKDVHFAINDDGSPDYETDLVANVALAWNSDDIGANPLLPTDITKLSFTNAGDDDATVVAGFLLNL